MDDKVQLTVLGLSYSQIQSGAHALILSVKNSSTRIPLIIGTAEANSIAMILEGMRPPRPITHDLFVSFAHAFGIKLKEVFVYKFEDGVFYSELTFGDGDRLVSLDARTSDAIAIAMRTNTPIFTTRAIVDATGFEFEIEGEDQDGDEEETAATRTDYHAEPRPENYTIEELERTLQTLIDSEDYEEAARIADILAKKRNQQQD